VNNLFDYQLFHIGNTPVTAASLIVAGVILGASYLLGRLLRGLIANRLLRRTHLSTGIRYALGRFTGYIVFFLGAVVALQTLGVNATTLAAFGAALGVGIGFGLQDLVKNFVAGLVILIERPIQVGDRIELDKNAAEVVEIRARATVLRTNDDVHLIVPNAKLTSETVVNRSYNSTLYRCRVPVGVSTSSDPRAVERALLEAAAACEAVLENPKPDVRFRAFGESALEFQLLCWTDKMLHRPGKLISDLNFEIQAALERHGVELASPQTEVKLVGGWEEPPPRRSGIEPAAGSGARG
jgi:small-conductance mechanosensitive channel